MSITAEQLVQAGLASAEVAAKVVDSLNAACQKFGIVSGHQLAGFLSQCSHESERFTHVEENLNYRAQTLIKVWPKNFDDANASSYSHRPDAIANRAYAGHMGNGDEKSGDGWRFHGRGFIQLTGRANYHDFGAAVGEDVVTHPEQVAQPRLAAMSAAWFWHVHGLNALADAKDVVGMTRKINGGILGLDERRRLFEAALVVFV